MTDWRIIAIRHSIEIEALYITDHWRIWARTRDANSEMVMPPAYDSGTGETLEQAIAAAIGELARKMFPCEADPSAEPG